MAKNHDQPPDSMRVDRWLWTARFFRSRALAAAALRGGKVRWNGARSKPSRLLRTGDVLEINRGGESIEVRVAALSERRVSAALAAGLYEESQASKARREQTREDRRIDRLARPDFGKRPDKRARRRIRRIAGKDRSA